MSPELSFRRFISYSFCSSSQFPFHQNKQNKQNTPKSCLLYLWLQALHFSNIKAACQCKNALFV